MITPCVNICKLNPDGTVCTGCGRTIQEITDWRTLSDEQRRVIMARLSGYKSPTAPRDKPPGD